MSKLVDYLPVAYADIFEYPLKKSEIWHWHIARSLKMTTPSVRLHRRGKFFFLPQRQDLVSLRQKREAASVEKWKIAQTMANRLSKIPTVMCVGVTGGLSMNNADWTDDIDFFVITASGCLWITRVCAILLLGSDRRKPADEHVINKICLNMFMAENALTLPAQEQDLFSAHEVLQMKPLFDRNGTYLRFLRSNKWVKSFLPEAWKANLKHGKFSESVTRFKWMRYVFILLEPLVKHLQLLYMKRRRTNELIQSGVARFHPIDARFWVKHALRKRLQQVDIPLDNIFYRR